MKTLDIGESMSGLIGRIKAQDPQAAQRLWERYFDRMVRLARDRLRNARKRVADEEDVALSAFDSFCRAAADGRFPKLQDSNDLWQVLLMMTERKAYDLLRRENAQKRGGGQTRGESVCGAVDDGDSAAGLDAWAEMEPSAGMVVQMADTCEHLLRELKDETLRQIAVLKMEGYENVEIAGQLAMGERTVERKLALIRQIWTELLGDDLELSRVAAT